MTGGDGRGLDDGLVDACGFTVGNGDWVGGIEGFVDGVITGIMVGFSEGFCVGAGVSTNRAGLRVEGC